MNITSFSDINNLEVNKKYNSLKENLEEFYNISLKCEEKISKLKLLGMYEKYIADYGHGYITSTGNLKVLLHSITKDIQWRGYKVLYIPKDINAINQSTLLKMGGKILIVGPGKLERIRFEIDYYNYKSEITDIILACDISNLTDLTSAFNNMRSLNSITIYGSVYDNNHKRTQKFRPVNMESAFLNDYSLKEVTILDSDFSNLLNLTLTFSNCEKLENIYIENFKAQQVHNMENCFENCKKLKYLNLSKLGLTGVDYSALASTFKNCYSLKRLDIGFINISNLEDINYALSECIRLEELHIKDWVYPIIDIDALTNSCKKLKILDIPSPIQRTKSIISMKVEDSHT